MHVSPQQYYITMWHMSSKTRCTKNANRQLLKNETDPQVYETCPMYISKTNPTRYSDILRYLTQMLTYMYLHGDYPYRVKITVNPFRVSD